MIHFVSEGNSLRDTLRWMDEWRDGWRDEWIEERRQGERKEKEMDDVRGERGRAEGMVEVEKSVTEGKEGGVKRR